MKFSPGIYEHAAALIRRSPWEVSRSAQLLTEAHRTAWQTYRHPLIVAGIDVYNLEPEAHGAVIAQPSGVNIPSIGKHPCEEVDELLDLNPLQPLSNPRILATLEAANALQADCPQAAVHVPVCGPFALAIGLLGMNELLMALVEDPDLLLCALRHLLQGQFAFIHAIHNMGLKPIIFESGTTPPLISADTFRAIEAPLLKDLFAYARSLFGEAPHCVIGGDATHIAESLLQTKPGWVIAPSETDQAAFLNIANAFPDIHVRVNMATSSLLDTSFDNINAELSRCIRLAQTRANTSVGCGVVPFETPPDTLKRIRDIVEAST